MRTDDPSQFGLVTRVIAFSRERCRVSLFFLFFLWLFSLLRVLGLHNISAGLSHVDTSVISVGRDGGWPNAPPPNVTPPWYEGGARGARPARLPYNYTNSGGRIRTHDTTIHGRILRPCISQSISRYWL